MQVAVLFALLAIANAAEWKVIAPNVMTIAFGVSASDNDTVYVSGADDGNGAAVLKSRNGGSTWESLPHDLQMMYISIDVAAGSTTAVAGSLGFWKQTSVASFSLDGENFFATPYVPLFSASQSVTAIAPDSFYLVSFWMDSLISQYYDGVISSTDGGKTLNFFPWSGATQARYGDFPSANAWYIAGGTWPEEKRELNQKRFSFNSYFQILKDDKNLQVNYSPIDKSKKNGYLGVIQKSVDGGKTFQTIFNDTNRFYFNGIDCTDENTCLVVAEGPAGAYIFKTVDGGKSWVELIFLPEVSLIEIQMVDANEGWAVGGELLANTFNALFLHTVDGGKTWLKSNSIPNAFPNSIAVPSSGRAYATAFLRNGLSSILAYF